MPKLIVMLIWVGVTGDVHTGAAAVIPGFASLAACAQAAPRIHQFYDGIFYRATIKCVALDQ